MSLPEKLQIKLNKRQADNALRNVSIIQGMVDFSSNDYLGFARSERIFDTAHRYVVDTNLRRNSATGSRLLTGNYKLYDEVEQMLCQFHNSEASLVFNSGYDANIGFFSSIPQRNDVVLYDELIHASIRDGIKMGHSKAYKFKHNDSEDLKSQIQRIKTLHNGEVYVVTESVFSMDGDSPDIKEFIKLCDAYGAHLIVDEAHAIGVIGTNGEGLVQQLGLENNIFARLVTFGKALGAHGAAILGSSHLKQYLVNFARSFIYTTALPPHSLATIHAAYKQLTSSDLQLRKLIDNITYFRSEVQRLNLSFIKSDSAIHCCIISGNKEVKLVTKKLQQIGFDVRPILSPTVPQGKERLRFCLHSYNSKEEITKVLEKLTTFA